MCTCDPATITESAGRAIIMVCINGMNYGFLFIYFFFSCPELFSGPNHALNVLPFLFIGRYDLHLPNLSCKLCLAQWTPDMSDLIRSGYWPASVNADTLFSMDVFTSFEELKTVAPSLSRQGFLRMLEKRTCQFGRVRSAWIIVASSKNIL